MFLVYVKFYNSILICIGIYYVNVNTLYWQFISILSHAFFLLFILCFYITIWSREEQEYWANLLICCVNSVNNVKFDESKCTFVVCQLENNIDVIWMGLMFFHVITDYLQLSLVFAFEWKIVVANSSFLIQDKDFVNHL